MTSPPYYGLRDYGTGQWEGGNPECKHRFANPQRTSANDGTFADERGVQKKVESARPMLQECRWCGARRVDSQIGLEVSVEIYVQRLVEVFREVRRVLTDDGTLWLNIGDSYITRPGQGTRGKATKQSSTLSGGVGNAGGSELLGQVKGYAGDVDPKQKPGMPLRTTRPNRGGEAQGLKHKDLIGVPWRLAFALQADGWWLRDDIIWEKANPLPESVRDRPTRDEYLFLLSKSASYYYDYEAMQEPAVSVQHLRKVVDTTREKKASGARPPGTSPHRGLRKNYDEHKNNSDALAVASGENAHRVRGFQERWDRSQRLAAAQIQKNGGVISGGVEQSTLGLAGATRNRRDVWRIASEPYKGAHYAVMPTKLVEPCVLAGSAPGDLVLDPFFGSGTVGVVAVRHDRNFVGMDLDPKNVPLANERIYAELPDEARYA